VPLAGGVLARVFRVDGELQYAIATQPAIVVQDGDQVVADVGAGARVDDPGPDVQVPA